MHDIRWIRDNKDSFDAALTTRGLSPQAEEVLALDQNLRAAQTAFQTAQARRNEVSKAIGQLKRQGGDASALMAEVEGLKATIADAEQADRTASAALEAMLAGIPNLPADRKSVV